VICSTDRFRRALVFPNEFQAHRALSLGAALNVPVLSQVICIDEMPCRRMKMPGMGVEIRGFAKLKINDRSIRGLPADVTRLIGPRKTE
jgi:hypothetical protein